jgi:hypothetical protein
MSDDRNHRPGHRRRGKCCVDERRLDVLVHDLVHDLVNVVVIVFRGSLSCH